MCGTVAAPRYKRGKHSVYHAFRVAPPTKIVIPIICFGESTP